jgi:GntR family transcriptional repressor for pyruvate dehydrogenase complex
MVEYKFKPIEQTRVSTKIMEQLIEMIYKNEIRTGECLPSEAILATKFGASRPTVREALSGLKALNLINSQSGKGNFVSVQPDMLYNLENMITEIKTRSSFLEALEARSAIEGEICWLAAQRANKNSLELIKALLDETKEGKFSSFNQFCQTDHQFHLELSKASGNSLFVRFIEEAFIKLSTLYWEILDKAKYDHGVFPEYLNDHQDIFIAIQNCNPHLARESMLKHIERIKNDFLSSTTRLKSEDKQIVKEAPNDVD